MSKKDLTTYVALDVPQATPEDFAREQASPEWEEATNATSNTEEDKQ